MATGQLDLRVEPADLYELFGVVDVLRMNEPMRQEISATYLHVLTRNLDVVKLGVVEFLQPAAGLVEGLQSWPGIQCPLVAVSPRLQTLDIFAEFGRFLHEVILDGDL